MRIIAGTARGLKLLSLDSLDTRPTLDRVKEPLFSMLMPYLDGADVLDLFAGSGALGLEALSRGASKCTFVDKNPKCRAVIEGNIKKTRFDEKSVVKTEDFAKLLKPSLQKQSFARRCGYRARSGRRRKIFGKRFFGTFAFKRAQIRQS